MAINFSPVLAHRILEAQALLGQLACGRSDSEIQIPLETQRQLVRLLERGRVDYVSCSFDSDVRHLGLLFDVSPLRVHGLYLLPGEVELAPELTVYHPVPNDPREELPQLLHVFSSGAWVVFERKGKSGQEVRYLAPSLVPVESPESPAVDLERVRVALEPDPAAAPGSNAMVLSEELTHLVDTRLRALTNDSQARVGLMEAGGIIFVGDFLREVSSENYCRAYGVGRKSLRFIREIIQPLLPPDYEPSHLASWRRPAERMNQAELRVLLDRPIKLEERLRLSIRVDMDKDDVRYVGDAVQLTKVSTISSGHGGRYRLYRVSTALADALFQIHPFLHPRMEIPWWSRPV